MDTQDKSQEETSFIATAPPSAGAPSVPTMPSAPTMPTAPAVASSKAPKPPAKKETVAQPRTPEARAPEARADRPQHAARRFTCVLTVHLDGEEFPSGAPIELTDEQAEQLLSVGAIAEQG
jgi:hypothetical protein